MLNNLASQIHIKLNNTDIPQNIVSKLESVTVDQHAHLPDMFEIRFNDPDCEILDDGPFELTAEIEISAETTDGSSHTLTAGEITSLEPQYNEGMVESLVIRGYNKLHRLFREVKSKTYLNTKDSDMANQIAQSMGLNAVVDATNIVYDHVFQHNQSDFAFIKDRAYRLGFECFISEGNLYFRKPPTGSATVTLTWGEDLVSFLPRMTLAEQVDEVIVKGWDINNKAPIVGRASTGNLYPQIGESQDGASLAQPFGKGNLVIVNQPVVNQTEADTIASARLDEISGAFIDAEGTALRRPDIKPGQTIRLEALGRKFSGTYLVTHCVHSYDHTGFTTNFTVNGTRSNLITEQITQNQPTDRWPGVVPAIVTNTEDPNDLGRVKLKFPWLSDESESDWARVIGIGAGPESGYYAIPAVDDEVMVSFVHGDFSQPIVIGGVWNGQNKIPPDGAGAASGEKPLVRTIQSTKGHKISMFDNADKKIEITSIDGLSIVLDDNNKKIEITTSAGKVTMESSNLTIEMGGGNLTIKSSGNLKLEASGNIDIQASGTVKVQGAMIDLN